MNKSYRALLNQAFIGWITGSECSLARQGSFLRVAAVVTPLLVVAMFGSPANAQYAVANDVDGSPFVDPGRPETEQVGYLTEGIASEGLTDNRPMMREQKPTKASVSNVSHGAVDLRQAGGVLQDLNQRIDGAAHNAYAGVAAAMAVQIPGAFVPGKTVVRLGTATFKGESALGLSMRRTSENNGWSLTGGVGVSRAGLAAMLGAEWVFN